MFYSAGCAPRHVSAPDVAPEVAESRAEMRHHVGWPSVAAPRETQKVQGVFRCHPGRNPDARRALDHHSLRFAGHDGVTRRRRW